MLQLCKAFDDWLDELKDLPSGDDLILFGRQWTQGFASAPDVAYDLVIDLKGHVELLGTTQAAAVPPAPTVISADPVGEDCATGTPAVFEAPPDGAPPAARPLTDDVPGGSPENVDGDEQVLHHLPEWFGFGDAEDHPLHEFLDAACGVLERVDALLESVGVADGHFEIVDKLRDLICDCNDGQGAESHNSAVWIEPSDEPGVGLAAAHAGNFAWLIV